MEENNVDWARLAGEMLVEGRAAEAFAALEIAAPDVTAVTVAAAARALGAEALLYLHPTDPAGRMAGALCLDATTGRLEVLANGPVTDPLCTDDPGWPAILSRFSSHLVVAATGRLGTLALPAVRTAAGRYAAEDLTFTYATSGAHLQRLAAHPPAGPGATWLWPVPAPVAALALHLVDRLLPGRPPAHAIAAVQRWMLNPAREVPAGLPAAHRATLATTDLTRPEMWAALAHRPTTS